MNSNEKVLNILNETDNTYLTSGNSKKVSAWEEKLPYRCLRLQADNEEFKQFKYNVGF